MGAPPKALGQLSKLAALGKDLVRAAALDPLLWVRWTLPQQNFHKLNPKGGIKLLRGGNQAIGKTWAGLAEVIWRATGTHPYYPTRIPPVEIWVVCTSWSQSIAIMRKFWALVPRSQITSGSRKQFSHRRGWGKDNPTVEFLNGSIVRFRTTNQGSEALAGASIDYVHIDEPTDEEIFRELHKRVMRSGGQIGITLTPVNRDCTWLRKMVEAKIVEEEHARLELKNLIPIGATEPLQLLDGTPMDQAWIEEQIRITPAMWIPVVLHGEWETKPEGIFFKCFDAKKHVRDNVKLNPALGPIRHVLGFDYAAADRAYGHVASLCQVQQTKDDKGRFREAIYIIDEVVLPGVAHNSQFARDVVAMLTRNGLRWSDLYSVHGDNPVTSQWVEKSNLNTLRAVANELQIPQSAVVPRILNAKDNIKSAGSFDASCQYLYERIASGNLLVHPRCKITIRGFETWDYSRMHQYKDICDATRYSLRLFAFPRAGASNVNVLLH